MSYYGSEQRGRNDLIGRLAKASRLAGSWSDAQFPGIAAEVAGWAVHEHCLIVECTAREVDYRCIAVGACYGMLKRV